MKRGLTLPASRAPDSVGLRWEPRTCTSVKFQADALATGPGAPLN